MSKFKIGSKVRLRKSIAKWTINHLEIFYHRSTSVPCKELDVEMPYYLLTLMDFPVEGKIVRMGCDCWNVQFKAKGLAPMNLNLDEKDLEFIS